MEQENSVLGNRTDTGKNFNESKLWCNLLPEALAEIFSRLPFEERLTLVPQVCKGWRAASYYPSCWLVVDMAAWIRKKVDEDFWWEFECEAKVEHLVKTAVDRSCGQLRELRVMHASDGAIDYIAERCPSLLVLAIPDSLLVTDKSALKLAAMSPRLKQLDVSDCHNISKQALEAFGRNCPSLTWLGRNMLNLLNYSQNYIGPFSDSDNSMMLIQSSPGGDEEAEVMSKHMGGLKHLEMKKTRLSDRGLRHLVIGCRQLENLDLACCTSLSPQAIEDANRNSPRLKKFTKPITPKMYFNFNTVLFDY